MRLGYLVDAASWSPQYRLRGSVADAPVRLEYLAAVVQQTGESWSGVSLTLSTARPSLDAAPPELLPLKMAVAGAALAGPIDAHDDRSQTILAKLEDVVPMSFKCTSRMDNLLRRDVVVPQDTVADKTMYLSYEFRLEYARDLPQPRFVSGGLREGPIGGGAMGGMGGMMGGMRSIGLEGKDTPR